MSSTKYPKPKVRQVVNQNKIHELVLDRDEIGGRHVYYKCPRPKQTNVMYAVTGESEGCGARGWDH